jgi:hypothetical protein
MPKGAELTYQSLLRHCEILRILYRHRVSREAAVIGTQTIAPARRWAPQSP